MPAKKTQYGTKVWGREVLIDLEVPSGELCQVRRPGVMGLIKAGVLDSLDSLSGLVDGKLDSIDKGDEPAVNAEAMRELSKNKEQLSTALGLMDKVICYVVVQPKLSLDPPEGEERDPAVVYASDIDIEDKAYIFQFVLGGTKSLESFRSGFAETLGALETGQDVSSSAV